MEDRAFQAEKSMDKGFDREQGEETEARVTGARIPSSSGSNQTSPLLPRPSSQKDRIWDSGAL